MEVFTHAVVLAGEAAFLGAAFLVFLAAYLVVFLAAVFLTRLGAAFLTVFLGAALFAATLAIGNS